MSHMCMFAFYVELYAVNITMVNRLFKDTWRQRRLVWWLESLFFKTEAKTEARKRGEWGVLCAILAHSKVPSGFSNIWTNESLVGRQAALSLALWDAARGITEKGTGALIVKVDIHNMHAAKFQYTQQTGHSWVRYGKGAYSLIQLWAPVTKFQCSCRCGGMESMKSRGQICYPLP